MTKYFELDWKRDVPKELQDGAIFDRWTEEKDSVDFEAECKFKVDECGFFISWKSDQREGDVLELSQVNDIRPGTLPSDQRLIQQLKKKHGDNVKKKSLTICSGLDMVNINSCNIICRDEATAETWKIGLRKITNNIKMNNACPKTNLRKHWTRILLTTTVEGKVSVKSIAKTFASGKTEKLVYQTLAEIGLPSEKSASMEKAAFTFEKFYKVYQTICPRTDIDTLFNSITKTDTIPVNRLIEFMNEKQRDPRLNEILYPSYTEKRCMEIISMYETDQENVKQKQISKAGLTEYMLSDENAPVILDRLDIYQEMDQPLAHYYINSSHNTYLTGRQFGGKSSVEIYRQVLLSGCRCVELDCWDGKDKDEGEVIITHGHAMCTNVYFKDVIEAIRDTAFVASEYPVILSFENHCNRENQRKMAKYCIDIFGDLLLKECIDGFPLEKGKPCPPPNKLLRKILIKNKRLKPEVEKSELELYLKGELDTTGDVSEDTGVVEDKPPEEGAPVQAPAHSGSTSNVHPLLSSIVNYTHPIKFQGFDAAGEMDLHYRMSSFAEPAALGYLKSQAIEFVNYNKRQFSRIYPKGARVDSSNFMPQIFWNAGCQLVSLNFQTPDLPMQLNQGKFEYNGNCGYLLKPEFMRKMDKTFDPFAETPVDGVIAAQCGVEVISGQFLSTKREGTYVEVDMYGLPTDTIKKEFRTKVIPANGLNPTYNEEPFQFRKVVLPELAVLRFGVYNEEGKLLGQRILPFNDLQAGYRHISLKTEGNFPMSLPMLFINVELKIYVPDGLGDFMDALCDPRAFLSAQEKRAEQLKALGIEETDISGDVIESKGKSEGGAKGASADKKEEVKEELKLEPITSEMLKTEKGFAKIGKKQAKEIETMQKKQKKERDSMIAAHCKGVEKLVKSKKGNVDYSQDPDCLKLTRNHTQQWTDMVKKFKKEEWELLKAHAASQEEVFKKLFEQVQAKQMKEMEAFFSRETKDMMASQAKVSVDTAKEVQSDATLKTKADKDRRLREKNQANTKKFMDERKNNMMKQNKKREKQKKTHEGELDEIVKYLKDTIEYYKQEEIEFSAANKKEAYI